MIDVRPLTALTSADLNRLIAGYTSNSKYLVSKAETDEQFAIRLELVELSLPYVKVFEHDAETIKRYLEMSHNDFSLGAYDKGQCVGIALAEPRLWNQSLAVIEFHISQTHKRQGIGRRLLEAVIHKACEADLRIIVCETQSTNSPAIDFYRKMGFHIGGIDLSCYSNTDFPDGEIAIFMKKRIKQVKADPR